MSIRRYYNGEYTDRDGYRLEELNHMSVIEWKRTNAHTAYAHNIPGWYTGRHLALRLL